MIRKKGKARWTYACKVCGIKATYPDQFRAIERKQRHLRSVSHTANVMVKAFEPLADSFRQLGLAWSLRAGFENGLAYALADSNRPYDPSMLRDRRRWGGR